MNEKNIKPNLPEPFVPPEPFTPPKLPVPQPPVQPKPLDPPLSKDEMKERAKRRRSISRKKDGGK